MKTKINLVTGNYTYSNASEMLLKMIEHEQQFQNLQNFTSLIRYEGNCQQATENIHRLSRAKNEIKDLVDLARSYNLKLKIETSLHISLVEDTVPEKLDAFQTSL